MSRLFRAVIVAAALTIGAVVQGSTEVVYVLNGTQESGLVPYSSDPCVYFGMTTVSWDGMTGACAEHWYDPPEAHSTIEILD